VVAKAVKRVGDLAPGLNHIVGTEPAVGRVELVIRVFGRSLKADIASLPDRCTDACASRVDVLLCADTVAHSIAILRGAVAG
jgi:hypothetical protein